MHALPCVLFLEPERPSLVKDSAHQRPSLVKDRAGSQASILPSRVVPCPTYRLLLSGSDILCLFWQGGYAYHWIREIFRSTKSSECRAAGNGGRIWFARLVESSTSSEL